MKHARVTYQNGTVISTSINGTDGEIKDYFKIGRIFNIGSVEDNLQRVVKCEILPTITKKNNGLLHRNYNG